MTSSGGMIGGVGALAGASAQQQQFSMVMRGQQEQYVRMECLKLAVAMYPQGGVQYSRVLDTASAFYEFVHGTKDSLTDDSQ